MPLKNYTAPRHSRRGILRSYDLVSLDQDSVILWITECTYLPLKISEKNYL